MTAETMPLLIELAKAVGMEAKIAQMFDGTHLNATEDRAVGHVAQDARCAAHDD